MAGAVPVGEWRLRPLRADEREWAYALHRAALGGYVEATWGWEESLQRRIFSDAVERTPRCGLRVVAREPTRLTMRVKA